MADLREPSVSLFEDICLGNYGNIGLAVIFGEFKGRSGYAPRARLRGHLEIHVELARYAYAAAAEGVFTLRIFTEESPVDALLRNAYGSHVGVEIEGLPQGYISALKSSALKGGSRPFKQYVAGLYLLHDVIRYGLIFLHAVFNGKALYVFDNYPAGRDLVL